MLPNLIAGIRPVLITLAAPVLVNTYAAVGAAQPVGAPLEEFEQVEPARPDPLAAAPGNGFATPAGGAGVVMPTDTVEPPRLVWRIENPFRFFADWRDTQIHWQVFRELSPEQALAPVLSAEHLLNSRYSNGWAGRMYRKTCWNWARNRHECPDGKDYINPESHAVLVEIDGVKDVNVNCTWVTAPVEGDDVEGRVHTSPCRDPFRVDIPYPAGLNVSVLVGGQTIASDDIRVRDILIAGIGDSFASGEGNPDVPVRFSRERTVDYGKAAKDYDLTGYPARAGKWKQLGDTTFIEQNARWLDQACHRSLYSHQLRTALQLALEDPHRAVTFVGVSCTGAEITWGLFLRYKGNEWVPNPPDLSQISALADIQCGTRDAKPVDLPEAYHMRGVIDELHGGLVLRRCDREQARPIDLLLVSVGGNDIGFARLIANAVLADQSLLKKLGGWFGQLHEAVTTEALLKELDDRYKALNRALHSVLHIPWQESDRVVLSAYPPLALLGDSLAVCPDGSAGMDVMSDFALSQERALTGMLLADRLHSVMKKSAETYNWTFSQAHRTAFIGRGICAGFTGGETTLADDLRLPRKVGNQWVPYNPADYRAYASRQRWFRTPNDAYLTGHFHVAGSVLQKALKLQSLSWFQVLLASTYSGAFHPTAEGQAAIADAVVGEAREVLRKYGQSPSDGVGGP